MSFFDRLGDLAKSLGEAAVAQPRFIWDMAQAPFNDNQEYNGFKQTLSTAASHWAKSTVAPIGEVANMPGIKQTLETAMVPYRNYVAPAIGAGLLAVNPEYQRENANLSGMDLIAKAFQEGRTVADGGVDEYGRQAPTDKWRRKISPGQALIGDIGALIPGVQGSDKVDWRSQESINSFYGHGMPEFFSGASDLGFSFLDPTLALGKVSKAVRSSDLVTNTFERGIVKTDVVAAANRRAVASERIMQAADSLHEASLVGPDAVPTITNEYTDWIKRLTAGDVNYALSDPLLDKAPARSTIAYALGESSDFKTTGLIAAGAGLGNKDAIAKLKEMPQYYDIGASLERAQGEVDALARFQVNKDLHATTPDGQMSFEFAHQDPAVNLEAKKEFDSLMQRDATLRALVEASQTEQMTRGIGSAPMRALDKLRADTRAAKYAAAKSEAEKKIFGTSVTEYQPTPFHKLIQIVNRPFGERPSGHVNLNDSDSLNEVAAAVERGLKLTNGGKLGGFDTNVANKLITGYASALTPEARSAVVKQLDSYIATSIMKARGVSEEKALEIYAKHDRGRTSAIDSIKKDLYMVDSDGSLIRDAWLSSQTANSLPMMDYDLLNSVLKKNNPAIPVLNDLTTQTIDSLDFLNELFKAGALIRAGYLVRNTAEAQLRIGSTLGTMTSLRHLGKGMNNFIYNTTKNPGQRAIDRLESISKSPEIVDLKSQLADLDKELAEIETKMSAISAQADHPQSIPDLHTLSALHQELSDVRTATNASIEQKMVSDTSKRRLFTGTFEHEALNGKVYKLTESLGGDWGDIYRAEVSSANTVTNFIESGADIAQQGYIHTGTGVLKPDAVNYFSGWADTLTRSFGNSAVAKMLANQANTPTDVINWMLKTEEGRAARRAVPVKLETTYDVEQYVARTKNFLDNYLPSPELQQVLSKPEGFEITEQMLRDHFAGWDVKDLPTIHGDLLEENLNMNGENILRRLQRGAFHLLGDLPEDSWSRNPVYNEFYNRELTRRIDSATVAHEKMLGKKMLPTDELPANIVAEQYKAAHQVALRETKKLLFTIDRRTNAATTLRWVLPFFSAYLNTTKTWGRIIAENPQVAVRGYTAFTAPNRAGNAYDENGNLVSSENASMNDTIILQVPEGIKKLPFVGKGLSSLDQMGVQKKSLDVIMQGNIGLPVGPPVSIAASEIVKRQPKFEDTLRWAIPYGPDRNAAMALLPAWAKRQITKGMGQDSPEYANTYELIWNTEQFKRKQAGQDPASEKEIKDMTDAFYNMRTVANLILPFAPSFKTPYKFYIDQFHSYQNLYGIDAKTKFFEDYPDFFTFSTSLSKNNTGAAATVGAVDNSKKYADLIADVRTDDPKLIGLIANSGVTYEFSKAAYMWQQSNTLSPGSSETFRGTNDPVQAQKETEASLGWIKYRKVMDQIDAVMESRGLSNLRSAKAADLAAYKKILVQQLGQQNKAWYDDYLDSDGSKTNKAIRGFEKILSNEKFMADHGQDPTWKSLAIYLNVRNQVSDALVARGGTAITNKKNADLAAILETTANHLKQQDIGFGDIYDRYLDSDRVYDIVYSTKAVQ